MDTSESKASERFFLVDALRGVAAVIVLLFHLFHNAEMLLVEEIKKILPLFVPQVVAYGYYGVQIFFVLSGFVIAHSLRKTPLSSKSVGNFVLRRQLRLDPPFWTILFVTCFLLAVESYIFTLQGDPLPSFKNVLMNMAYLYKITNSQEIVSVAWTLCIEIQFYLVFIVVLAISALLSSSRKVRREDSEISAHDSGKASPKAPTGALFIVLAMGIYSILAHWSGSIEGSYSNPWFIVYWCHFAGGVLCYWTINKGFNVWIFLGYLSLLWLYGIGKSDINVMFGAATLSLLSVAGLKNRLTQWGNIRPLQYLGRISYSLYLVHTLAIGYLYKGAVKMFGLNPLVGLACIPLAILISLAAAHLLHISIERPSMKLSGRFRLKEKIQSEVSGFAISDSGKQDVVPGTA